MNFRVRRQKLVNRAEHGEGYNDVQCTATFMMTIIDTLEV